MFSRQAVLPSFTFVQPVRFPHILLSLRTPGRCLVIEGPSGIGKTTAIENALKELGIGQDVTKLSARRQEDVEYVKILPETRNVGTVLVDDFHKLDVAIQQALADYLKVLADSEDKESKIIILGINRAGDNLIRFAADLVNRIDIVRFETEPDGKIQELIEKGSQILRINIPVKDEIIADVRGSFYLTQMLCREICVTRQILQAQKEPVTLEVSYKAIQSQVWDRLDLAFGKRCKSFCIGPKIRKQGRAPYLHILKWLADAKSWTLDLRDAMRNNPASRGSVGQVLDKGFLGAWINKDEEIRQVLHFAQEADLLTIDDPLFLFYVRNVPWREFARELGFVSVAFERRYDFALSFAGSNREVAELLFAGLTDHQVEVFYDKNEQHRFLAQDVEEYLRPIYQSEAQFVVVLLGRDYPKRIWTKIESDAFRTRISEGAVIPIWFSDVDESAFDTSRRAAGITWKVDGDPFSQSQMICDLLVRKLAESRSLSLSAIPFQQNLPFDL
jgi:hypothetical protein